MPNLEDMKIAIIGLGYVGLPVAVEFGKQRLKRGFDINEVRVDAFKQGREVVPENWTVS